MPVTSIGSYDFPARDVRGNFPAPLLYIGWDEHLMFSAPVCLPLPADMPFAALLQSVLPGIYSAHPDFAKIEWDKVEWLRSGEPWKPDPAKTLAENGLGHKDALRFRTPGLHGIGGSGS